MTRGKYGYTDPSGKAREYSYSMGVKCDQASEVSSAMDCCGGDGGRDRKKL